LFKEGKFNEAISVLKRSLELFKKCKNQEKEAICLSTIASCYRELGGLKRAIEYCSLAQKKDPTNKKIEEKLQGLKELQERGLPTLKI
jgi:tetratricopeptide (TPR) repeat protein